jgi:hypothetical protein
MERMMAVFHPNHDELHGFTVCVETNGAATYIGRWDHQESGKILLNGASIHMDGDAGLSSAEFIKKCALWGVEVQVPSVIVEAATVKRVRKLGEVANELRGW